MSSDEQLGTRRALVDMAIAEAYGHPHQPTYFFKHERLHSAGVEQFVTALAAVGQVEETTDLNVDCARVFSVHCNSSEWIVWRSLVGPFTAMVRLGAHSTRDPVESVEDPAAPSWLGAFLEQQQCLLLTREELAAPVRLQGLSAVHGVLSTFAALFSDTEYLPWETPR